MFLKKMLQTVQNLVCELKGNLFSVGGKKVICGLVRLSLVTLFALVDNSQDLFTSSS